MPSRANHSTFAGPSKDFIKAGARAGIEHTNAAFRELAQVHSKLSWPQVEPRGVVSNTRPYGYLGTFWPN